MDVTNIENLDGFIYYLNCRAAHVEPSGSSGCITWEDGLADSAFATGWRATTDDNGILLSYSLPGDTYDIPVMLDCANRLTRISLNLDIKADSGIIVLSRVLPINSLPLFFDEAEFESATATSGKAFFDKAFAKVATAVHYLLEFYCFEKGTENTPYSRSECERFILSRLPQAEGLQDIFFIGDEYGKDGPDDSPDLLPSTHDSLPDMSEPVMEPPEEYGFNAVCGLEEVKRFLQERVVWILKHREQAARYRINMPALLLLYGPPDCGKNWIAERLAEECGLRFMHINFYEISRRIKRDSQLFIARIFMEARKSAPCVLCFNGIDTILPREGTAENYCSINDISEFLYEVDCSAPAGVFIVGITETPGQMGSALLNQGRPCLQLRIPKPDTLRRQLLFEYFLAGRPVADDVRPHALAFITEGVSCADIRTIINIAAVTAASSDVPISEVHLEEAVKSFAATK